MESRASSMNRMPLNSRYALGEAGSFLQLFVRNVGDTAIYKCFTPQDSSEFRWQKQGDLWVKWEQCESSFQPIGQWKIK